MFSQFQNFALTCTLACVLATILSCPSVEAQRPSFSTAANPQQLGGATPALSQPPINSNFAVPNTFQQPSAFPSSPAPTTTSQPIISPQQSARSTRARPTHVRSAVQWSNAKPNGAWWVSTPAVVATRSVDIVYRRISSQGIRAPSRVDGLHPRGKRGRAQHQ